MRRDVAGPVGQSAAGSLLLRSGVSSKWLAEPADGSSHGSCVGVKSPPELLCSAAQLSRSRVEAACQPCLDTEVSVTVTVIVVAQRPLGSPPCPGLAELSQVGCGQPVVVDRGRGH